MADLSQLGGLQPVEQLDLNDSMYADAKESQFRLPSAGIYTLRAPDSFPQAAFGRTKKGALSIQIDPTIVSPEHEGFTVRFIKVSGTVYTRDSKRVSQIGDYLRATGFKGTLADEQAQADAVESTAGTVYEAELDWRVYEGSTGFSLEGMRRFPKNADGTYQSWINSPTQKDEETGEPTKLRANLFVRRFVAKAE